MTLPQAGTTAASAVIDGIDVDSAAAAVQRCPGVAALDGGPFGEVATYLPGRKVPGVVVGEGRVTVQVRSRWGVPAPDLAALIPAVVTSLTGPRPVDVVIADVDDPPAGPSLWLPAGAGPPCPLPGLPPA